MMRISELDLEREDVDVLREVVERAERGATAGEIRGAIGWASENHQITYRYNKLEERRYIETEKDPNRGKSNQLPPRVAWPTDDGVELVESVEYELEDKTLVERVERVEQQLSTMRETYAKVKERIVALEEELEEVEGDVDGVAEDLEGLRRYVEQESAELATEEFEFSVDD